MRDIPEELAARIDSGAATLCHAWIVTRADNERLGFTDHDRALVVEGVVCSASSGWTAGASETATGLAAGSGAAAGALDDEALSAADIEAGLYDRARVELWRVDWSAPELRVRLWAGTIGKIRAEGGRFSAELDGPMAALDRVMGRTYGRLCDAVLGDARCGVDLADFPGTGCDKRWATCRATFANGMRFRGFPDIPGDYFLTAFPAEGGRHDGGRRR